MFAVDEAAVGAAAAGDDVVAVLVAAGVEDGVVAVGPASEVFQNAAISAIHVVVCSNPS